MEEENKLYIKHKVQAGFNYTVYRNDRNGKSYYKICVTQKAFDGQESKHYIPVTFKKGIELPDKTKIKIKKAVENVYKKGFDTIFTYELKITYPVSDFLPRVTTQGCRKGTV